MRFFVDCGRKVSFLGLLEEERWPFILADKLFLVFTHIEGIVLEAGEEVNDVARGTNSIGMYRMDKPCDMANNGQAVGMFGTSFTARLFSMC